LHETGAPFKVVVIWSFWGSLVPGLRKQTDWLQRRNPNTWLYIIFDGVFDQTVRLSAIETYPMLQHSSAAYINDGLADASGCGTWARKLQILMLLPFVVDKPS